MQHCDRLTVSPLQATRFIITSIVMLFYLFYFLKYQVNTGDWGTLVDWMVDG